MTNEGKGHFNEANQDSPGKLLDFLKFISKGMVAETSFKTLINLYILELEDRLGLRLEDLVYYSLSSIEFER